MKICHVSFGRINRQALSTWLKTVPYFTAILTRMADGHEVYSFHFASSAEETSYQNVNYRFSNSTLIDLVAKIHSLRPDVIILHGFHSSYRVYRFAKLTKGFRIFVQHHGEKVFTFPKSALQKRFDKNVSGYFFSSSESGMEWVRAGQINNSMKIFEVLEVTSSFSDSDSFINRNKPLNFIWVGRLNANKDPLTLIEGFTSFLKTHSNANLYLIFNTNELLAEVKAKANEFQNNIHFIGEVEHGAMPAWYTKCDFIISTSFFEAGGVSVLEGISCGCIPILSDIPAFKKITFNGKIGLMFTKGSPEALTNALNQAATMNVEDSRRIALDHFEGHLSATAIANEIIEITSGQKAKSSFSL